MRTKPMLLLLAVCSAVFAGLLGSTGGAAAVGPCGTASLSSVNYTHVIWIWMENHSYGTVIGSPQAPYLNGLATKCGLATNYHNISPPSLPNYVGATSGLGYAALQKFTPDCSPAKACSTSAPRSVPRPTSA